MWQGAAEYPYSELLRETGTEAGTFGYHVRQLGEFLEQDEEGLYSLSDMAREAFKISSAGTEAHDLRNKPTMSRWILQSIRGEKG